MSTLLIGVLVWVVAGCRTAPPMEPVDLTEPGWRIHRGQALWQPRTGTPELIGEILIASNHSGEEFIRFSKDPMEIVVARRNRAGWEVMMPWFDRSRSGRGQPPHRIGWFQLAATVFGDTAAPGWDWVCTDDGRWMLTNQKTGERLEGFFRQ